MALGLTPYLRADRGWPAALPRRAAAVTTRARSRCSTGSTGCASPGGPDLDPAAYGAAAPRARSGPTDRRCDTRRARPGARRRRARAAAARASAAAPRRLYVARGGTLRQHVDDHRQTEPATPGHARGPRSRRRLAACAGLVGRGTPAAVNSFHHQAAGRARPTACGAVGPARRTARSRAIEDAHAAVRDRRRSGTPRRWWTGASSSRCSPPSSTPAARARPPLAAARCTLAALSTAATVDARRRSQPVHPSEPLRRPARRTARAGRRTTSTASGPWSATSPSPARRRHACFAAPRRSSAAASRTRALRLSPRRLDAATCSWRAASTLDALDGRRFTVGAVECGGASSWCRPSNHARRDSPARAAPRAGIWAPWRPPRRLRAGGRGAAGGPSCARRT